MAIRFAVGRSADLPGPPLGRDDYLLPYVNPDHTAVEIGPGGGRWSRYLLGFGQLCTVDFHQELLDELQRNIGPRIYPRCATTGPTSQVSRMPASISCSRSRFVHLDIDVIEAYFRSMHRILKPSGCAVIQYSDKNKEAARKYGQGFSHTTPEIIRPLVVGCGHRILEEDITTVWHSSIVRFAPIPYPEETSNSQDEVCLKRLRRN